MDHDDYPIEGRTAGNHLMLVVPVADRHFWSPWLNLELIEEDESPGSTHIKGRFSPNPSVWTGFMLVYSSLGVLAFLAVMFGAAQMIMGNSPWALWFLIVLGVIAGSMYWASLVGQKIAHDQMQLLYRVTLETLGAGSGVDRLSHVEPELDVVASGGGS